MKNLSHLGSNFSSSSSTPSNMADDGGDLFFHYFNAYLTGGAVSESVPVVEAGTGKNGALEGMGKNGVVEGLGNKGKEWVVEAAEEVGYRKETGGGSNEGYGGFEFDVLQHSIVGFEMSKKMGAEWTAGGPSPGCSLSGFRRLAGGRSVEGSSMFAYQVGGVEAPPQGMVNNRGVDWMGVAPAPARGYKRKRSPSGSIETASGGSNGGGKRVWVKDRDRDGEWWDTVSSPGYPDADFKRAFHMSRSTFAALCRMVAPAVAKEDTALRAAIPVPKRVAVCVYRLSTGEPLRQIAKRFAIGISTCDKILLEVSAAISSIVLPQVVLWPDATTAASMSVKFQALTGGIPDVVGAVYTTHIPIIAPKNDVVDYYNAGLTERNGKTSYSISLQASVDADGAFTDVWVGQPGATPDEDVLLKSWLKTRTVGILSQGKRLVGGAGYPLMDWMLVPYSQQNLTHAQHEFNLKVAAGRAVAVDAFRRLKTRWACLQKRTAIKVKDLPAMVSACCALHNLCERSGDELDPELPNFELVDNDVVAANPVRSPAAAQVRDAMANNLLY